MNEFIDVKGRLRQEAELSDDEDFGPFGCTGIGAVERKDGKVVVLFCPDIDAPPVEVILSKRDTRKFAQLLSDLI